MNKDMRVYLSQRFSDIEQEASAVRGSMATHNAKDDIHLPLVEFNCPKCKRVTLAKQLGNGDITWTHIGSFCSVHEKKPLRYCYSCGHTFEKKDTWEDTVPKQG